MNACRNKFSFEYRDIHENRSFKGCTGVYTCILYRYFSKQTTIQCLVCVCMNTFQIVLLVKISSEYINIYVSFWLDIHLGSVSTLTCSHAQLHACFTDIKTCFNECLEIYNIHR